MAYTPYPRTAIELPVADRHLADTLVRQKAVFLSLSHVQAADGQCTCEINVRVDLYAADGAGYGQRLVGNGFGSYNRTLSAANDTLVDITTGEILAVQAKGQPQADWQAIVEQLSQARDTMLQGDFFEYLRDKGMPGSIADMIRHHIQQADTMGRFA